MIRHAKRTCQVMSPPKAGFAAPPVSATTAVLIRPAKKRPRMIASWRKPMRRPRISAGAISAT